MAETARPPAEEKSMQMDYEAWGFAQMMNGPCIFSYRTSHALRDLLETPGYFDPIQRSLGAEDRIMVSCGLGGSNVERAWLVVADAGSAVNPTRHVVVERL